MEGFIFLGWWVLALTITTFIGTEVVKRWRELGWGVFTAMLSSYLIINMLLVPRVIQIPGVSGIAAYFGFSAAVVSGTVFWPFIGQGIDMINEIYGRNKAYVSAGVSFLGRFIVIMFILMAAQASPVISDNWPLEREEFWQGYFAVSAPRILLAALGSYALQQFLNIYVYAKMKVRTADKETTRGKRVLYGWGRSQVSDFVEALVDSPTFFILAFAFVLPWSLIFTITISAIVVKMFIGLVFQEPFYAWFRWRTFDVEREF